MMRDHSHALDIEFENGTHNRHMADDSATPDQNDRPEGVIEHDHQQYVSASGRHDCETVEVMVCISV